MSRLPRFAKSVSPASSHYKMLILYFPWRLSHQWDFTCAVYYFCVDVSINACMEWLSYRNFGVNKCCSTALWVLQMTLSIKLIMSCCITTYHFSHTVDPGCSLDEFVIEPRSFRTELEEAQNRHDYESEVPSQLLPSKHQILNCLAAHGHWITTQPELQVRMSHMGIKF